MDWQKQILVANNRNFNFIDGAVNIFKKKKTASSVTFPSMKVESDISTTLTNETGCCVSSTTVPITFFADIESAVDMTMYKMQTIILLSDDFCNII